MRIAREVIELAIQAQLGRGPDIAQEKRLSPAGMGQNEIGRITLCAQVYRRLPAGLCARSYAPAGPEAGPDVCIGRENSDG
mgnify:CR=1 FL=1